MFQYVGGDFPDNAVFEGSKIAWDVSFTNHVDLRNNIERLEVLPEKEEIMEEGILSVVCYLKDGRHFIADVDQPTYNRLAQISRGRWYRRPVEKKKMFVLCVVVSTVAALMATAVARTWEKNR